MEDGRAVENVDNKVRILIIGAGMAGLSAANHLIKNGITDFKVLEARSRIGGRIIGINVGNQPIELGANWIHGVLGNPMYELAMANGLINIINIPKPHKVIAVTKDGKQVAFDVLQEIYEAYVCFLRRCEEYFLSQYLPPPDINSVGEHISLETAMYLNEIPNLEDRKLRQLIFDCLLKRETCITGCHSMHEIDLLELGSYTELQGGNIVLPGGYSTILGPVSKHIPKDNILLNTPVSFIKWADKPIEEYDEDTGDESDHSGKTVICENESSLHMLPVEVTCEDGQRFVADHVICTIPLGVLKESADTMFSPKLPLYKHEAIERLLYGTVDKIFLEYDRPFLNPNISEVMLLWDDDSNDSESDMKNNWFKKIYSFSKLSETVLLGWISGKEAEFMETLPNNVIAEQCTKILRCFLNDPFVPKPKQCIWLVVFYTYFSL